MTKVAIFFANYGPYHLSRIQGFSNLARKLDWQTIPLELTRSGIAYEWKTQVDNNSVPILSVLGDKEPEQVSFLQLIQRLEATLQKTQPDVVAIAGYFRAAMLGALLWCRYHKVPAILLSESKEDDAYRSWLSEKLKSLIIRNYKAALVGGQAHRRYLLKLGMSSDSISFGYNVVGNGVFSPEKNSHLPRPIKKPYFLSINRFILKKNLLFLLEAYAIYRLTSTSPPWDLVLCGSGQLLPEINENINRLDLADFVHLPGFLQQEQLLPYFAHASCFVHASLQEQWGLVVNEAMAAGLPVLVSNRCGCFEDLVIEGVNGFGFDPENLKQFTELMLKMSSGKIDLKKMSQASVEHIQKFSPDYFAQGLAQAIKYALAAR